MSKIREQFEKAYRGAVDKCQKASAYHRSMAKCADGCVSKLQEMQKAKKQDMAGDDSMTISSTLADYFAAQRDAHNERADTLDEDSQEFMDSLADCMKALEADDLAKASAIARDGVSIINRTAGAPEGFGSAIGLIPRSGQPRNAAPVDTRFEKMVSDD